jgi:hypothetical protein
MKDLGSVKIIKSFATAILCFAGVVVVSAAVTPTPVPPYYVNDDPVAPPDLPPLVDASIFINRSSFIISNSYLFPPLQQMPWSAQSVQVWTNLGVMVGLPGFRFDYTPNPAHLTSRQRRKKGGLSPQAALIFDNSGEISVSDSLTINAKKIINSGVLSGDVNARFRLFGGAGLVDLSRGAIRVGDLPQPACIDQSNFFFGPFVFNTDPAVNFRYIDSGVSGFIDTNRTALNLSNLLTGSVFSFGNGTFFTNGPLLAPPAPLIPQSQYRLFQSLFPGAPATNVVTNILTTLAGCGSYQAFVHVRTNFSGPNIVGRDISVVFAPTNGFTANVSIGVAFPTNSAFFFGADPIVEIRAGTIDPVTLLPTTNFVTIRNGGQTIFRGHDCQFDLADQANTEFASDIFYTPNFLTNLVDYSYTVAEAHVGNTNSFFFTNTATGGFILPPLGQSPAASDPTNFPGRLEITTKDLDLTQARLRAENGIFIRATNLVGNESAFLDAPFVSFDVGTTNSTLVISNMLAQTVSRVQADINTWSGSWSVGVNTGPAGIETRTYRVLVLGACVSPAAAAPAIVHRFNLSATNLVIEDNLLINASLLLKGRSLTIGENGGLNMPRNANIAFTNLSGIINLTNLGIINTPDTAFFGVFEDGYVQAPLTRRQLRSKKPLPPRLVVYDNFINHGSMATASTKIRSGLIEISGTELESASVVGSNGVVSMDGGTLILSNADVRSQFELQLTAGHVLAARTYLSAGANGNFGNLLPGAIILNVTNSLTDGGVNASNDWHVTSGIRMTRTPATRGDLLGTRVVSRAGSFVQSVHAWAGENRGATPAGFSNNLALGRLVLDGSLLNRFRFRSTTVSNAIYVDYLELQNDATNYNGTVAVDPDFTIYFGDSNVDPVRIEGVGGGRIKWVSGHTGAQSSTNILYPNGITYTFNAGLVRSMNRDDDGDGFENGIDCTPIPVPGFDTTGPQCPSPAPLALGSAKALASSAINLHIALAPGGSDVVLHWDAPANSANAVEFTESLSEATWQTLTNFINGPVDARVTVKDGAVAPTRIYRVLVGAGKP